MGVRITVTPFGTEELIERLGVFGVAVADQEPDGRRSILEGEGEVARLLADPGRVGIGRDAGHMNTPVCSSMKKRM